jgi:glutathione S-transferase
MLTLYYKPTCPFCQRVLEMAENLQVDLDLQDVSDDESVLAELIEKGGKKQVPFLVDTEKDVSMYESNDIIEHLREHYAGTGQSKPTIHQGGATCVACEG